MRKRHTSDRMLQGQLLFAEIHGDGFTLDCLLAGSGQGASDPITLDVTFPPHPSSAARVERLLQQWAEEAAAISVVISDRPAGVQIEIAADSGRLVLVAEEGER